MKSAIIRLMNNHTKGILLVFLGVVLMSVESPIIQISKLSSQSAAFYFAIFLVISSNLLMLKGGTKAYVQNYTNEFRGIFYSGFFMGLSNFFFFQAVVNAGIANTVLILATSPIVSALIAFIFLKQKTHIRVFIATFFVFIGLYIILSDSIGNSSLFGIISAFVCVFSFSSMFVVLAKYKKASRLGYVSFGGLFVILFSIWEASFYVDTHAIVLMALMGLLITPFSRLFIGLGTRYIKPAEVGLLVIGESILAPLWGWWWLGEVPSSSTLQGGGIILMALFINSFLAIRSSKT